MKFHFLPEMNRIKRLWMDDEYPEVPEKKQRRDSRAQQTISCLEKLPNEIFLEIFEYLEGEKLYKAFKDLNTRLENLLAASNLRIQARLSSERVESPQEYFNNVIAPNGHHILALDLSYPWGNDSLHLAPPVDASFVRLEFLQILHIHSMNLIPLLTSLADIPRLTSLKLSVWDDLDELSDVYQLIFALPSIKFLEMEVNPFIEIVDLLIPTPEQCSQIEYLAVNHQCTVNDLLALLSYTPKLRRLTCERITDPDMTRKREKTTTIPTLARISISEWRAGFDDLEAFLTHISSQLECLTIKCIGSVEFLNAERWERLITQHLPRLWRLNFTYEESIDEDFVVANHHQRIHRFSSSFWTERHWKFNVCIDTDGWYEYTVSYVISTDKRKDWTLIDPRKIGLSLDQDMITSFPTILSESEKLSIKALPDFDENEFYIRLIGPLLVSSQITCLHIDFSGIFAGVLIDLIQHLPHLHSLVVKSVASMQQRHLSVEETRTLRLISQKKSIGKVQLVNADSLSEIQFLLDLCSGMQYLQIDHSNDIDLECLVRFILMKNVKYLPNLFCVCFGCPPSKIDLLQKLINMIDLEQLRRDYTIEQSREKIYLRWTI